MVPGAKPLITVPATAVIQEKRRADLAAPLRCFARKRRLGRREVGESEPSRTPDAKRTDERATARLEFQANEVKRKPRSPGRGHVDARAVKARSLRTFGHSDFRHLRTLLRGPLTGALDSVILCDIA